MCHVEIGSGTSQRTASLSSRDVAKYWLGQVPVCVYEGLRVQLRFASAHFGSFSFFRSGVTNTPFFWFVYHQPSSNVDRFSERPQIMQACAHDVSDVRRGVVLGQKCGCRPELGVMHPAI